MGTAMSLNGVTNSNKVRNPWRIFKVRSRIRLSESLFSVMLLYTQAQGAPNTSTPLALCHKSRAELDAATALLCRHSEPYRLAL